MQFNTIEIGGKLRPIRFSYAALYEYEKNTGRSAIDDFAHIQTGIVSVQVASDLIYAGLSLGCKTNGSAVDFTVYDVADWAFAEQSAITKAMQIFSDSFPKTGPASEDGDDEKKPRKSRLGTT